jgi:hypothetical protein
VSVERLFRVASAWRKPGNLENAWIWKGVPGEPGNWSKLTWNPGKCLEFKKKP